MGKTVGSFACLTAILVIPLEAAESGNVLDPVDLQKFAPEPDPGAVNLSTDSQPSVEVTPPPPDRTTMESREEPAVELNGLRQFVSHLEVVPMVQARVVFDDNIFSRRKKTSDVYYSVAAGLVVGAGDFRDKIDPNGSFQQNYERLGSEEFQNRNFVYAGYKPRVVIFTNHGEQDTLDHDAFFGAQWGSGNLLTGLHASLQQFSEGDAEVGDRVRQLQTTVGINARYEISDKTSVDGAVSYYTRHYDTSARVDSSEWYGETFINYQIMPKTSLALGGGAGYLAVSEGPDQSYQQILGRMVYSASDKLKFTARGGAEFRQVNSSESNDEVTPIFSLGAEYSPYDDTTISLVGRRYVRNSIGFVGENVTTTGLQLALTQRVGKVILDFGAGYQHDEYTSESSATSLDRTDDLLNFGIGCKFHFTKWVTFGVAYSYRQDLSTEDRYDISNNRASLQVDILF